MRTYILAVPPERQFTRKRHPLVESQYASKWRLPGSLMITGLALFRRHGAGLSARLAHDIAELPGDPF
ncbi:MAG TPA: hypothetical protein VMV03_18065, partial [Spirochaetia bacterium]|nr:hypothetical protein [Spirochaetia bacterium]